MSTGEKRTAEAEFKSISKVDYFDYGQTALRTKIHSLVQRIFPKSGIFPDTGSLGAATASVAGQISVGALEGTDGQGHIINFAGDSAIPVPNELGTVYSVGLKYADVVSGTTGLVNWETGKVEYRYEEEQVGEKDNPDSVTIQGTQLRVVVDGVVGESGVDYSGRTVRIWLVEDPVSDIEDEIYEDCTVQYSGGTNFILVTRSLGQRVASTTASDYYCWMQGVSVFKKSTKDLSDRTTNPGYIFITEYTGTGVLGTPDIDDELQQYFYSFGEQVESLSPTDTATEYPDVATDDNGRLTLTGITGGVRIATGDSIVIRDKEYAIGQTDIDGLAAGTYFLRCAVGSTGQLEFTTAAGTRATDAAGAGGGDSTMTNVLLAQFTVSGSPAAGGTIITYANKKRLWQDLTFEPADVVSNAATGSPTPTDAGESTVTHDAGIYWARTPVATVTPKELGPLWAADEMSPPTIINNKSGITGDTVSFTTTVYGATPSQPHRHWIDVHLEA